ncbi:hypothetical protein M409DRAFT_71172 [Zasmidium cellare ATCC 36951]|uniref:N-alpha-acetyltransferase 40 n=1 Tax=Zasmidium cellare ATCC 36951 TaxID=1080233 RepID=A0A6A6BX55_ZASCE|nr:uncharacterized protein M409DRAFT_71172 [Zasmidium cellare ATCC 36951]KAF2159285.1 hypothetical protein M409DRAFT_71172 [Zasmidium cellare ATCC 36951]
MAKRKSEAVSGDLESGGVSNTTTSSPKSAKRSKKADSAPRSDVIDEVNALGRTEFEDRYLDSLSLDYTERASQSHCNLCFANDISDNDFDDCFHLIDTTSRKDYEGSSWGWHPKRKRREMKEKEMRYIIAKGDFLPDEEGKLEKEFEGFLSFMFTHDSTPSVPVLYIYEIHLAEKARGKGLGLHLLNLAESMARRVGVKKVMLTCFLSNTNALNFYKHHGFRKDACSPGDRRTRNKVVKVDYMIMSKDVDATPATDGDSAVQVMEEEPMDSLISDRTDEVPSLDDCPSVMRAWIDGLKQQELLNLGLAEAEKARHLLSSDQDQEAAKHRDILSALFQCLKSRYEAARDLDEVLREQMYHLKSHILDVDRMAETLAASVQDVKSKLPPSPSQLNEESFDWDKATEQVYSAFYTLLRKAEEVDNRLDDIVEREQEADQREDDLDGREEELDSWENDIHEREKALADREERLMRSKRTTRTQTSGKESR